MPWEVSRPHFIFFTLNFAWGPAGIYVVYRPQLSLGLSSICCLFLCVYLCVDIMWACLSHEGSWRAEVRNPNQCWGLPQMQWFEFILCVYLFVHEYVCHIQKILEAAAQGMTLEFSAVRFSSVAHMQWGTNSPNVNTGHSNTSSTSTSWGVLELKKVCINERQKCTILETHSRSKHTQTFRHAKWPKRYRRTVINNTVV
jgi:hypothetical protein